MTRANKDSAESSTTGQQRVLITAGASGIGAAMVTAFLDDEAQVHVADLPGQLHDLPPGVTATAADVSDPDQVDQLFDEAVQVMGGVDVLCNNVGIAGPTGALEELEVSEWDRTMAVNVRSMFLCCRWAIPLMRAQESGIILNTASTAGLVGYPLRSPYAASKWAVVGLSATLAMELGEFNIRVNTLCPGSVGGDRMDRVIAAEAVALGLSETVIRERYQDQVSMRSFIEGSDVAAMALFLASPAARFVNGQVISVDGGLETLRTVFRQ